MSEDEGKKLVEKHEVHDTHVEPVKRQTPTWLPWVSGGALVIVLLLGAFWAGNKLAVRGRSITVARNNDFGTMRSFGDVEEPTNTRGGGFVGRRGAMGVAGAVSAISSDSITVKDTMRGGLVTFKINANTAVTSDTDTKAVSDIKTDATVRIKASATDSLTAASIDIQD